MLMFLMLALGLIGEYPGKFLFESQSLMKTSSQNSYYTFEGMNKTDCSLLANSQEEEDEDTLKEKLSFWRRLSFSIGYSGGLCWTGDDLMKSGPWAVLPWDLIARRLYWLNSIEVSAIYPVNEKWGVEVGLGYGWARLEGDRWIGDDWLISYIDINVGIIRSNWEYSISFCYLHALWFKNEYYGKGRGWKVDIKRELNSFIKLGLSFGNSNVNHHASNPPYNVSLLFNGIGFSLNYTFSLKGGVK